MSEMLRGTLVLPSGAAIGCFAVKKEDGCYVGTIDTGPMPEDLLRLFRELEETISGQGFSYLDQLEDKVAGIGIESKFDTGQSVKIRRLLVYPSDNNIAFWLA